MSVILSYTGVSRTPPRVVRVGFIVTNPLRRNFMFANRAHVTLTVLELSKSTRLVLNKRTEIHGHLPLECWN